MRLKNLSWNSLVTSNKIVEINVVLTLEKCSQLQVNGAFQEETPAPNHLLGRVQFHGCDRVGLWNLN